MERKRNDLNFFCKEENSSKMGIVQYVHVQKIILLKFTHFAEMFLSGKAALSILGAHKLNPQIKGL